jgi:hypothetical protein
MYVLWGFNNRQREPIKLSGGTLTECHAQLARRTADGWKTAIYQRGTAPTGLRDLAREVNARA